MYAGQVAEVAPLRALFSGAAHPYARLLLGAMPSARRKLASLPIIPGAMPSPAALPSGCRFHPRCPYVVQICRESAPPLVAIDAGRAARCWRATEVLQGLAA
jgi:oligopeptide transport system ATP-binding protein